MEGRSREECSRYDIEMVICLMVAANVAELEKATRCVA